MSIFFVNTQDAQISNAFLATLGAAPGSTYLAQVKTFGLVPSVQAMINATGSSTAAALSTKVATNLGLTGSALTGGTAYLSSVTFAGSSSAWAANLMETLNLFSTLQSDATYGSAATAYLARVNSAVSYSSVAGNNSTDLSTLAAAVGSAGSTGSGSTFTLTTGADALSPGSTVATTKTTSGDDKIYGLADKMLNTEDAIDGGGGIDTIFAAATAAAQVIAPTLTSIEHVEITHTGTDKKTTEFSAINSTGLLSVSIKNGGAVSHGADGEAETITLSNLAKTTTVGIIGGVAASGATGAVIVATFTGAAAADTQKVSMSAGGKATSLTLATAETVEITATGTGSTNGNTLGTLAATAAKNLIIKGTGDLTLTAVDISASHTIDTTGSTGVFKITAEDVDAVTTFKGGAGNDTISFAATRFTGSDVIDLGGGANTLGISDTALGGTATAALNAAVNNVTSAQTILILGDATVDMSGVTARNLSLGTGAKTVIKKTESLDKIQVIGVTTGTIDATAALGFNVLNLELIGGSSVAATGTLNVTSQATVNITSSSTAATSAGANTIGAVTNSTNAAFAVTGANALTITSLSAAASFDASAATGVITITGADAASILRGGSKADVITGATKAGGDELFGGAGNDTINTAVTTGTVATKITGGLGADTINLKGVATGAKVITLNTTAAESFATEGQFDKVTYSNHTDTTTTTTTLKTGVLSTIVTGASSVVIGTTAVTAGSFLAVGSTNATLTTTNQSFQIFQDTNGNGIIDATDLRVDFLVTGTDTQAISIVGSELVSTLTGVA